jgi:hypothetical protein
MLESLTNNPENLGETANETSEFVSSTEICGFEDCELINNEQLANYLTETIPPSHFEGCPSIEFDPYHSLFIDNPNTLGFYECGSHAIHVCQESRFSDGVEGMVDTVIHEIGHNAYFDIIEYNPELNSQWETLYSESWLKNLSEGTGFVSDYAMTNKYEDFAESYKIYVRDPEILQVMSPEKYAFLRDSIFSGREYPPLL